MDVTLGKDGLTMSWQAKFPELIKCHKCGNTARIGFVVHEGMSDDDRDGPTVCDIHPNEGKGGYWLHDYCAVAVYFCVACLETSALYNQG